MPSPSAPPMSDSTRLSVSSWRTTRPRPAPSADADRQLARAHRGARQQQVGDVGAADEQHEADDAEEQHRRESQIAADERVVQRLERDAAARVGLRELARQPGGDRRQVGSAAARSSRPASAARPPRRRTRRARAAAGAGSDASPRCCCARCSWKSSGTTPTTRAQLAVEPDLAADDGRVGVEARAPERLAQHDDVGALSHRRPAGTSGRRSA